MKKVMMMIALMAIPFALQAQTKFHDVELNEASGPVKTMVVNVMGHNQTINFSKEGKMQSNEITDAVYDADGFLKSAKMSMMGQTMPVTYTWENGKPATRSMEAMGQKMVIKYTYNEKGAPAAMIMEGMGETPYEEYQYDDRGNWISRSMSMMGQKMTQTRTIEYYE